MRPAGRWAIRVGRVGAVAVAVLVAQWLASAAAAPLGAPAAFAGAGPLIAVPWLAAGSALGAIALATARLGILWPWVALGLPLAIPDWPAAWLFTGPGVLLPWTCVAIAAMWDGVAPRLRASQVLGWRSPIGPAILGAAFLATVATLVSPRAMSGDAPHYLTVAQSLVADGDLDLKNNYDERTYWSFFQGPLEPRHTVTSPWGHEYSFHGLGTPVLIAPGFLFLGRWGATWTIVALMAAGAAWCWRTARDVTGSASAAWFGWAALVTSAPYAFHAAAVYPDGLAAAATVGALWLLAADREWSPSLATLALVGAGLATLPWLHPRLALPAGVLGLAALVAVLRAPQGTWTQASWLMMVPIISCAGWVASTSVMFGTWNPVAIILGRTAPGAWATAPQGVFGLLFDREFGLVPSSPVFACAGLGLVPLWRRRRLLTAAGTTVLVGVTLSSSLWVWWGGDSAPARFLTVVLPFGALALAALWAATSARVHRVLLLALTLSATTTMQMAVVDQGTHVYNLPDGRGSIFEALSPTVNAALALPSMLSPTATLASEAPIALVWLIAAALAAALLLAWPVQGWGGLGGATLATLLIGAAAASSAWTLRSVAADTPASARLALAVRMATPSRVGLGVWPPRDADALARRLELRTPESLTQPREMLLYVPNVPAGSYAIRSARSGHDDAAGCRVELGREAIPYAEWRARDTPPMLTLATAVHSVRVLGCASALTDVWLQPLTAPRASSTVARRVTRTPFLDVYALDDSSYPDGDGVWTGKDRDASFVLAASMPVAVRAAFAAGPAAVSVDLRYGDDETGFAMEPDSRRSVDLGTLGASPLPLRIRVTGGFPARLLSARDSRSLGVHLTLDAVPTSDRRD